MLKPPLSIDHRTLNIGHLRLCNLTEGRLLKCPTANWGVFSPGLGRGIVLQKVAGVLQRRCGGGARGGRGKFFNAKTAKSAKGGQ